MVDDMAGLLKLKCRFLHDISHDQKSATTTTKCGSAAVKEKKYIFVEYKSFRSLVKFAYSFANNK